MTTRRGFLAACIATCTAPMIVRASSLTPLSAPKLYLYGDGFHDDAPAFNALLRGDKNVIILNNCVTVTGDVMYLGAGRTLAMKSPMSWRTL